MQVPGATFWIAAVGFGIHHPNVYVVSYVLPVETKIFGNSRSITDRKGDRVLVDTNGIARFEHAPRKFWALSRSNFNVLFGISCGNGGIRSNGPNMVDKCGYVFRVGFPV